MDNTNESPESKPEATNDNPEEGVMDSQQLKGVKQEAKSQFTGLIGNLSTLFSDILHIREGTSSEGMIEGIKKDIDFKGVNVLILVFSIFIASIGLNVNSPAVVIGAMLISPLMGPILGVGLAVGINDWKTLIRSLRSLGIAVSISILTSSIYFFISPLNEASSELLARTRPTTLDVFVAIFGGLAGAIASSRKEKTNVVPGVAIATALMPPLCTAGYGLATFQFSYFFGAFYLFILNSIFISISTYVMVRYLRFPVVQFMDAAREKKVKRYLGFFVMVVIVPSMFIFFKVIKESVFNARANDFVKTAIQFDGSNVASVNLHFEKDTIPEIEVFIIGTPISDGNLNHLESLLEKFKLRNNFLVQDTRLTVRQGKDAIAETEQKLNEIRTEFYEKMYAENLRSIENKETKIEFLESELLRYKKDSIPFNQVFKEVGINYSGIQQFGFANMIQTDTLTGIDTIPSFFISWDSTLSPEMVMSQQLKLKNWLSVRLEMDSVAIFRYQ